MANFFVPSYDSDTAHAEDAASDADIYELTIEKGKGARFGIWGGGPDGKPLSIKVYRNSTIVSDGAHAAVKLMRASLLPAAPVQVFSAWGLQQDDKIFGLLDDGRPWTPPLVVNELTQSADSWAKDYNKTQV
jgi:hypothetical protein